MDFTDGSRISLVGHLSPGPCLDLELGNAKVADFDPRHIRGASSRQKQKRQTKEISEESLENSKRKKLLGKRYGTARKCGNWSSLRCLWLACPATCSETSGLCGWSWDWRYANNTLLSQYLDTFWSAEHRPQRMETLGLDSVDCNWTATAQSRKNPSKQLCFGPKNLNETKKLPQNCYPCFFLVFCVLKREKSMKRTKHISPGGYIDMWRAMQQFEGRSAATVLRDDAQRSRVEAHAVQLNLEAHGGQVVVV